MHGSVVSSGARRDAPGSVVPTFEPHLPEAVRVLLEQRYWRAIEAAAEVESFAQDPTLLVARERHPALFADHGTVHVRDVATGVLDLISIADGLLLPPRPNERRTTVESVAVLTAYLHDIGMVETSQRRRRVHPQWAAQEVYRSSFDDVIGLLVRLRHPLVARLVEAAPFDVPLAVVLREILAMSMCHSKTVVPAPLLDDLPALRALVTHSVLFDLASQMPDPAPVEASDSSAGDPSTMASPARRHYEGAVAATSAFGWLTSMEPSHQRLAADVIDAIRVLRAADALRQRGTVLRTSAGYEMFVDTGNAHVVYAIPVTALGCTVHLSVAFPIPAGEAVISRTAVTSDGHLRVWFHAGRFVDDSVRSQAVANAAAIVLDVEADVLPSFWGAGGGRAGTAALPSPILDARSMRIELVGDAGTPSFADAVARWIVEHRPDVGDRVVVVHDDVGDPQRDQEEHQRFDGAPPLSGDLDLAAEVVRQTARRQDSSLDVSDLLSDDVRVLHVTAGEELMRGGTAADFVYIPVSHGLIVAPLGGYEVVEARPWDPIGVTGVVRRGERNAAVHAVADLDVIVIGADAFRARWFRPLTLPSLVALVRGQGSD